MSFTDEYNRIYKLLKEVEEIDDEIDKLIKLYDNEFNYLMQTYNNNDYEFHKHHGKLFRTFNQQTHQLSMKKEDLETEINNLMLGVDPLFIRVGDLRKEISNYLEIEPKEVNLYARLITLFSPGCSLMSQSMKDNSTDENSTIKVLFRVYPNDSKKLNYDINDAFVYDLNNSMPQADGINLLDHMYKRVEDPDITTFIYEDVLLENDEVEDLYLKVPFQMLFTKVTNRLFEKGKLHESYHYDIREHRMEDDKEVKVNVFRTCVINYFKKKDIKNKTLVKK